MRLQQADLPRHALLAGVVHQPAPRAQSATWFIDARYWLHAEANRPSWSPSSRGSGPGPAALRRLMCPGGARARAADLAAAGGRAPGTRPASGAGRRARRRGTRGARSPGSCTWFGPASSIACLRSSWWTWRNSSVACAWPAGSGRTPGRSAALRGTRCGAGPRRRASPRLDPWRGSRRTRVVLEGVAFLGRQQVAGVSLTASMTPSRSAARGTARPARASRGRRGCGACRRCRRSAPACRAPPCAPISRTGNQGW